AELPWKVGGHGQESGPDGARIFTWHLAIATRPRLWMFSSVGPLGHDRDGNGGWEQRIAVQDTFSRPGEDVTLCTRTMTIEAYKHAPLPDALFQQVNPAKIDAYHRAIARELDALDDGNG